MNAVAVYTGSITIYWSAIVITVGIAAGLALTLALHPLYNRHNTAVWVMFPFALLLSVIFSRAIHWYCHIEQYTSFWSAMTDYSSGSFVLPGVLLGTWAGAFFSCKMGMTRSTGKLLDAVAPGMALIIAFIRLSALFNSSCRGRPVITNEALQRLPFGIAMTDAAGNVDYRFATFFMQFLLMLLVTVVLIVYYCNYRDRRMKADYSNNGNVARVFLLLYGGIEIIMDSTRYDSHLMHFSFLKMLNPYASFISIAQVFAAASILCVFIHFMKISVRANSFKWYHVPAVLVYIASLIGIGYLGEYRVQRTGLYASCYLAQGLSIIVMILVICLIFATCKKRRRAAAEV